MLKEAGAGKKRERKEPKKFDLAASRIYSSDTNQQQNAQNYDD